MPYRKYTLVLKWLTFSLFAYVGTVFVIRVDWQKAIQGTFLPAISLNANYLQALVAVFGTTISPYLFFWQSSEEVEEMRIAPKKKALKQVPGQGEAQLQRIRFDTYAGMAFSKSHCLLHYLDRGCNPERQRQRRSWPL